MKFKLVKNANKLILCFLGYSFLPESLKHLELGEYGLGVIYDYTSINFDLKFLELEISKTSMENFNDIISKKELFLVAFSLGVFIASKIKFQTPLKCAVAINGTPFGIDENFGIKQSDFQASLQNFNFDEFKKGCFLKDISRVNFAFNNHAKAELSALYESIKNAKKDENFINWTKAIISKKDMIFPSNATQNYFRNFASNCDIQMLNSAHFAFYNFTKWEQILAL